MAVPVPQLERRFVVVGIGHSGCRLVEGRGADLRRRAAGGGRGTGKVVLEELIAHKLLELFKVCFIVRVVAVGEHRVADGVGEVGPNPAWWVEEGVELVFGDARRRVDNRIHVQAVIGIARVEDGEELVHAGIVVGLGFEFSRRQIAFDVGRHVGDARRCMRPVRLVVHAVEDNAAVCALRVEHVVDFFFRVILDLHGAIGRRHVVG